MRVPSSCLYYFFGAWALCAPGCGTHPTGSPIPPGTPGADAGDTPDGGTLEQGDLGSPPGPYQTPFPPAFPQLLPGSGGVLTNPTLVPVFFPKDTLQSGVVTFLQNYIGRSASWQVMQEYGVGRGSVAAPVVLTQTLAATMSDADVKAFVAARVQDHSLPDSGAGTVYMLYFPVTVTVTLGTSASCKDFSGYHNTATLADGSSRAYVVVPRCSRSNLPTLTAVSSHEVAEAATDPVLTAYNQLGQPYGLWLANLQGAEVGDLCQNLGDVAYTESGVGVVSRLWSNVASMAGNNPCQPAPAGAAFFSVPILTELQRVVILGVAQNIESVAVAPGATQALEVRLLSPGAPGTTWTVAAQEVPVSGQAGGTGGPVLSLSWQEAPGQPRASGRDGTTLHLQLSAAAAAPPIYTTVRLTSTGPASGGGQTQTIWVATVRVTGG